MAGKYPRTTEPDRASSDPVKRWRPCQSFGDIRYSGRYDPAHVRYAERRRTDCDLTSARASRLGDRWTQRCGRQAWIGPHHAHSQNGEAGNSPGTGEEPPKYQWELRNV